jgi:membrane associated rhomboid family serine protease
MPPWEDTSAGTDKQTRPRRLTAINMLVLLNIAGFVATGFLTRGNADALAFLEFSPRQAIGELRLWQFVTYPFVQVIRLWFPFAFIPAAYGLFTLGGELEARAGPRRILVAYLALAAYGALAHAAWQYVAGPGAREVRTMGLLAPSYGLLLLAALRFPDRPLLLLFVFPVRTLTGILLLGIVLMAFCALWFPAGAAAVLGAAAAAVALEKLEGRLDRWREGRALQHERDRFLSDVETRRQVDLILEKISREGIASLSSRDLRILRKGSELSRRERGKPHE